MAIDASKWLYNFHIFWRTNKSAPDWQAPAYRMKVLDGGVLQLQERASEMTHFYAPDTWVRIRVPVQAQDDQS
jgi:hypothetical protein